MALPTYSITQLAREFALTPRTIRHYEEQGLLKPRREGANRLFSSRDRARLKLTLRSASLGFSLCEIKEIFDLYEMSTNGGQSEALVSKLNEWRQELERQRTEIDALLSEITFFAKQCQKKASTVGQP